MIILNKTSHNKNKSLLYIFKHFLKKWRSPAGWVVRALISTSAIVIAGSTVCSNSESTLNFKYRSN